MEDDAALRRNLPGVELFHSGLRSRLPTVSDMARLHGGLYIATRQGVFVPTSELQTTWPLRAYLQYQGVTLISGVNPDGAWTIRVLQGGEQRLLAMQYPGRVMFVRRHKEGDTAPPVSAEGVVAEDDIHFVEARWRAVPEQEDPNE